MKYLGLPAIVLLSAFGLAGCVAEPGGAPYYAAPENYGGGYYPATPYGYTPYGGSVGIGGGWGGEECCRGSEREREREPERHESARGDSRTGASPSSGSSAAPVDTGHGTGHAPPPVATGRPTPLNPGHSEPHPTGERGGPSHGDEAHDHEHEIPH
jgi:hypothetical protein